MWHTRWELNNRAVCGGGAELTGMTALTVSLVEKYFIQSWEKETRVREKPEETPGSGENPSGAPLRSLPPSSLRSSPCWGWSSGTEEQHNYNSSPYSLTDIQHHDCPVCSSRGDGSAATDWTGCLGQAKARPGPVWFTLDLRTMQTDRCQGSRTTCQKSKSPAHLVLGETSRRSLCRRLVSLLQLQNTASTRDVTSTLNQKTKQREERSLRHSLGSKLVILRKDLRITRPGSRH